MTYIIDGRQYIALAIGAKGIRGSVRVVRALSESKPVGTQGPIWQIDGRTV